MVAEEELRELRALQLRAHLHPDDRERAACIVALCPAAEVPEEADARMLLESEDGEELALVGTLDLHAVAALPGELLIGAPAIGPV